MIEFVISIIFGEDIVIVKCTLSLLLTHDVFVIAATVLDIVVSIAIAAVVVLVLVE